ncbi:GNAT superfamily N-acetyltransferase [Rhodobium orientis]|uniref:GNAT family N-acetyltransferase n=1 Tax=Rhodobium orientis TaxID=34017 RepID=UPI0017AF84A0|nr:GNAT family N-acetyltransferase [Rhodobium orientis]MBB4305450.1 GNAT superfamily N-acetyltransferase [Rhodobium orientis]
MASRASQAIRVVRRARPAEAAALSELAMRSKAVWGYNAAFMDACRKELTVPADAVRCNEIWLCEIGRNSAGFYELMPDVDSGHGEVRMCFVDPNFLRRGVGRTMWRHMEERARLCGLSRLGLDADPNAVPFYSAMGMAVTGEAPSGSIPGRMLPRMEKTL